MKISIENLQQRIEDKEKDKSKIRNEFKVQISELKQDKKRYEELLNLREVEMLKLQSEVKVLNDQDKQNKSKLFKLQKDLDSAKSSSQIF